MEYSVEILKLPNGKSPLIEWLSSLDSSTRKRINNRLIRLKEGNLGDSKIISPRLSELRFKFGSGYRIYFTETNGTIILLINGGDKSNQTKDIQKAEQLLETMEAKND